MAGVLYLGNKMVCPVIVQGGSQTPMFSPYRLENGVLNRISELQGNEFDGIEEIGELKDQYGDNIGSLEMAFWGWGNLTGNLVFNDLKKVPEQGLLNAFVWTNIEIASFPKLDYIGSSGFSNTFEACEELTDIYFNSLKTTSFEDRYIFGNMIMDCDRVRIHFPSNLTDVVSKLYQYPNFGGSRTVLAFDLDPTE